MKRIVLLIFLLITSVLVFPKAAFAEKINSYDVEITASKDGSMKVVEEIAYDFENLERHGIFRFIPLYSVVGDLYRVIKIEDIEVERNGKSEKFETTKSKEQASFKIGDPNKTITGANTYKISYTVLNGIGSNYEDHDEIYWNVTGNDWEVVIEKASVDLKTDFGVLPNRVACFTRGSDFSSQFCTFPKEYSPVITTSAILQGDGLTVVYGFPKGTFPPSELLKELPKSFAESLGEFIIKNILLIYLGINTLIPLLLLYWYNRKKNKKKFGKPAVNFDLPKDERGQRILPALAGTIDTATLERDDIVATLFDLAIRKYIRLEEIKTKKSLLPDSTKQKIIKLKDDDGKLNSFEKKLFQRLFKSGDEVLVDDLKKDFYKTYQDLEEETFSILVEKGYFVKNPKIQRGFLLVFGMMVMFTLNVFLGITLIFLSRKLIGRTTLGDEIDHKIDGLKLFLKSMNRNYRWQAKNFFTVEQMIPYAMSLGYINKFMEQLKIINPDYKPTWYSGYRGSFFTSYGGLYSSMSSNVTTSAPSSSSGFSGGSSGGGGGGGGGGSW